MNTANGKYFDGKRSKPYPAYITMDDIGLCVELLDEEAAQRQIRMYWTAMQMCERLREGTGIVKAGEFPYETLEISDSMIWPRVEAYFDRRKPTAGFEKLIERKGRKGVLFGIGFLVSIVLLWYFILVPVIASLTLKMLPYSVDQKLGAAIFDSQSSDIDTAASKLLQAYYDELHYPSPVPMKVVVVDRDIVNAFALPGGYIVVYSSILKMTKSHEELAGLLAHETIHVTHRHSMDALARTMASYMVISVLTNDAAGASGAILENADNIYQLSYTRGRETDADTAGVRMMNARGLSSAGMVSLFENMQKEHKDEGFSLDFPEFMTTHPAIDKRVAYLKDLKNSPAQGKNTQKLEELYKALMAKVKPETADEADGNKK